MKKLNIVKENRNFNRIISNYKPYKSKYFYIYLEKHTNNLYKFGFSVGKKNGNAVARNKIKRRLKNILDKNSYQNNFNCIIICRRGVKDLSYDELKKDLNHIIEKLNLIKGETNEK